MKWIFIFSTERWIWLTSDARLADTIVLWGANPFETGSVFYTEHMLPNLQGATIEEKKKEYLKGKPAEPTRMIIVDPRRTASVTVAEAVAPYRVLHLRPNLGTDYVLANAIARAIWESGKANGRQEGRHRKGGRVDR